MDRAHALMRHMDRPLGVVPPLESVLEHLRRAHAFTSVVGVPFVPGGVSAGSGVRCVRGALNQKLTATPASPRNAAASTVTSFLSTDQRNPKQNTLTSITSAAPRSI